MTDRSAFVWTDIRRIALLGLGHGAGQTGIRIDMRIGVGFRHRQSATTEHHVFRTTAVITSEARALRLLPAVVAVSITRHAS